MRACAARIGKKPSVSSGAGGPGSRPFLVPSEGNLPHVSGEAPKTGGPSDLSGSSVRETGTMVQRHRVPIRTTHCSPDSGVPGPLPKRGRPVSRASACLKHVDPIWTPCPAGVSRKLRVLFLIAHDRQIELVFHVELHPSSGREQLRSLTPRIHADARVVAKAEYLERDENAGYLATSPDARGWPALEPYDGSFPCDNGARPLRKSPS
jgi:hypothetical protein